MPTLDEVIKALETDPVPMAYTARLSVHEDIMTDALHYLKEYQKIEDEYEELKDWWAEEHAENVPLTWDELKQMEGKPVWVEALLYKQWAVIAYVSNDHIRFEGANLYAPESRVYMGDANGWQAYRKERE